MSLEYDDEETDRLLAAADDLDFIGESHPRTSPELLGAAETPTFEAAKSTAGMARREGSDGELRRGEGLCQGPSLVISDGRFSRRIPSNRQGRGNYTLEEACYFCVDAGSVAGLLAELLAIASRRYRPRAYDKNSNFASYSLTFL